MKHRARAARIGLAVGCVLIACSGGSALPTPDAGQVCEPGTSDFCPCPDGTLGSETCLTDGTDYQPCVCDMDAGGDATIIAGDASVPDAMLIDVLGFFDTTVPESDAGTDAADAATDAHEGGVVVVESGTPDVGTDSSGLLTGLQSGAPWPMFGRVVTHQALSPLLGAQHLSAHWAFAAGDKVLSSPAVAADGTIYFACNDAKLYAVDAFGSPKWTFPIGIATPSSPAIGADGTIYVGGDHLYAVNPDGTPKWAFVTTDPVYSSPAVGPDGTIYVRSDNVTLWAVNPGGSQKWMFASGVTGSGHASSSPALGPDGTVYVGDFEGLYAVDAFGMMSWNYPIVSNAATPTLAPDGTIYIGALALDSGGGLKWASTVVSLTGGSAAVAADGTVYIGGSTALYALEPVHGMTKWMYPATGTIGAITGSPAVGSDGTVYAGSADHSLYAVTAAGLLKFSIGTVGNIESSPAIGAGGIVLVGDDDAHLYAIGP